MKNVLLAVASFPLRFVGWFLRTSWKKKIATSIALLVLIFVITAIVSSVTKKPEYTTATAERTDIIEVVSETGSIIASGRTDVYSPTNGIIEEVLVKNGDVVTENQELFTVESSATVQEQQAAYSAYLAAATILDAEKAQINSLQAELFRTNQAFLNDRGVDNPSQDEKDDPVYIQQNAAWLQAEADYKNQQKVISQAQANATATYLSYQATQNATVNAPVAGMVTNLAITTGSTVKASLPTNPTTPVLIVQRPSPTEVVVGLSETDIAKVKEGQRVTIDVNAIQNKLFDGVVRRVDTIGTDDQGVIRYNVYLEVLDGTSGLRPGMNVDVDIVTSELTDVLSVPNAAVKPYQGGRAVRVFDQKTREVTFVPVTIGVRGEERTEIVGGIEEGQEVITALSNEQLARPGGLFGN